MNNQRTITELVVHAAATTPAMQNVDAKWIDRVHRRRGFLKIGYHFVILRDGRLEDGRPVKQIGAHVKGFNAHSIGICMAGGIDKLGNAENNFTDAQFETLHSLLINLRLDYPEADISGHRDFSPDLNGDGKITSNEWLKMCPCFDVREWCQHVGLSPVGDRPPSSAPAYKVELGDTLWLIAKTAGTTVKALCELNDLNPNRPIYPGNLIALY
jgi:N-acetylmuramoyl-L-alanine amidase